MESTGTKKTNHLLPWLNAMVTEPYFLFHFLSFFSYVVARTSASEFLSPDSSRRLLRREIQAFLAFSVVTVIKLCVTGDGTMRPIVAKRAQTPAQLDWEMRFKGKAYMTSSYTVLVKEETWEAFIADTLLFAKGFLIAVSLILDYHLTLCYMVGFLVISILTQQPAYHGLGNANQLTPLQLETFLTEGNTSRFWLVEFRALCSSTCIRTSRFFPDLSITYSNKNISFGIVDLGHFPNAAEKFGISLGVSMGQLPTYILFENAVEVARFPEVDFESKSSSPTITKNLLCRHFELDRHLLEYVSGK